MPLRKADARNVELLFHKDKVIQILTLCRRWNLPFLHFNNKTGYLKRKGQICFGSDKKISASLFHRSLDQSFVPFPIRVFAVSNVFLFEDFLKNSTTKNYIK
jgi:hypothetical protein